MNPSVPEAWILAERPHLAAVAALESLLAVTISIFINAYPNLFDQDPDWITDRSAEDAYADAIIQLGQALEPILQAYGTAVERELRLGLAEKNRAADGHF
jgi:hypothetical protein